MTPQARLDENKLIPSGARASALPSTDLHFERLSPWRSPGSWHDSSASASGEWLDANPTRVKVGGRLMIKRLMGRRASENRRPHRADSAVPAQEALGAAYEDFKGWDIGDLVGASGRLFRNQERRAVGARGSPAAAGEVAAARCRTVDGLADHRDALPAALRRPDRERGEPQRIPHPHPHRALPARLSRCARFLEVETPMMQRSRRRQRAPLPHASHALIYDMYLRVAPELYLKRLIVAAERVYEINRTSAMRGCRRSTTPNSRCSSCISRTPTP